jgi:hypothetical protein
VADSAVFEWVCDQLIERSTLDRLESRGTVRIALKQAGLEARNVTASQMRVILQKVLAQELLDRDVADGEAICAAMAAGIVGARLDEDTGDSPDEVFRRLGGS